MMLMGYWSCAVQPGTAMTAHGDDEVRRHKGCRTFLLRPRARRPSDPELPPRRSKSTYTLSHPPETARRLFVHADGTPLSANIAKSVAHEVSEVYPEIRTMTCLNPNVIAANEEQEQLAAALTRYQEYLRAECGFIMLDGLPADSDVGALKLRLENLFVPLHVIAEPGADSPAPRKRSGR